VDPTDDLHAVFTANCGAGCILELDPGTYTDVRVTLGPAGEVSAGRVLSGSLTGITGEVLIRAADPQNKPILRHVVGAKTGAFYFVNAYERIRLENLRFEGRRSEQTVGAIDDPCADTAPADGICDLADPQSNHNQNAFWLSSQTATNTEACLLNLEISGTVSDAIFIRDAVNTTVENVSVSDIGCSAATCPALSLPSDYSTNSIKTVARGVNLVGGDGNVGVVQSDFTRATKFGVQCIDSLACHILGNTVDDVMLQGVSHIGSSGSVRDNVIRGIGFILEPNLLTDYTGHGIAWTTDATYGAGRDVLIDGNFIDGTFDSGIATLMPSFPGGSDVELTISNNVIRNACAEGTRANSAALEMGDNGDTIARIRAELNVVGDHGCDAAIRSQRVLDFEADRQTVSGSSTAPAVVYDDVTGLDEDGLVVDEDIQIDAGSAGTLTNCTLNSGAVVSDSSGGAVARTSCG
jgi:hypothetical protein